MSRLFERAAKVQGDRKALIASRRKRNPFGACFYQEVFRASGHDQRAFRSPFGNLRMPTLYKEKANDAALPVLQWHLKSAPENGIVLPSRTRRHGDEEEAAMERNIAYPTTLVSEIQVRVGWAQVELFGADIQEVQIAIAGDDRSVREMVVRHENEKLTIEQPQYGLLPHFDSKWLQIQMRVPREWCGNVLLITVSGAISVRKIRGKEVHLDTASGTVRAEHIQCDAFEMNAVSGAAQSMRVVSEKLQVRNVSSAITLSEMDADTVKVISISGQVVLDFVRPFRTLDLQVATGDTQVHLPGGRAEVAFRSVSGKLSAEGFAGGPDAPGVRATTITGSLSIRARGETE